MKLRNLFWERERGRESLQENEEGVRASEVGRLEASTPRAPLAHPFPRAGPHLGGTAQVVIRADDPASARATFAFVKRYL